MVGADCWMLGIKVERTGSVSETNAELTDSALKIKSKKETTDITDLEERFFAHYRFRVG